MRVYGLLSRSVSMVLCCFSLCFGRSEVGGVVFIGVEILFGDLVRLRLCVRE